MFFLQAEVLNDAETDVHYPVEVVEVTIDGHIRPGVKLEKQDLTR